MEFFWLALVNLPMRTISPRRIRLASVQTGIGAEICRRHGIDPADPVSLLVVDGARVRRDSDAVLFIYEQLGFPWRLAGVLRLVPARIRDGVYRWVARHRYRLFGQHAVCALPRVEQRHRFL